MNFDTRQIVLLIIAIVVPFILMRMKRHQFLLIWICFTFFVQIFDTVLLTNLPAGRIVGLLYLPSAISQLRQWAKLTPVKAWLVNYGWLLVLALLFGFIWPWLDTTYNRPFTLTAPGRSIIYSARLLADLSLAVFIANEILHSRSLRLIGRVLVIGSTASAIAGIYQFVTKVDLYNIITGLGEEILYVGRSRGLVGEPRALGLSCAYAVMFLLIGRKKISALWPVLLFINLIALLITYSASSLALFAAGIVVSLLFFSNRERLIVAGVTCVVATLIFLTSVFLPDQFKFAIETLSLRFDPDVKLAGIPPGNFGQEIAYRLDVFDACAMLFMLDQPIYALSGTGPGLVSLPASSYIPPGLYSLIWTPEQGVNSPPYHGLLLEISNSGLLGIVLWITQVISCLTALRFLSKRSGKFPDSSSVMSDDWKFGYALFLIGAVFYMVQVSYTPLWCVFLGIGWVAVKLYSEATSVNAASRPQRFEVTQFNKTKVATASSGRNS
ncbi:MAG: O-antigen ligase family protein [Acidobacteriota bacterium]